MVLLCTLYCSLIGSVGKVLALFTLFIAIGCHVYLSSLGILKRACVLLYTLNIEILTFTFVFLNKLRTFPHLVIFGVIRTCSIDCNLWLYFVDMVTQLGMMAF